MQELRKVNLIEQFNELCSEEKYRLYRDIWHRAGKYQLLPNFPMHLDIELSGVCNLKCNYCFQNGLITKPLGLMDYSLYKKILDEGSNKGLAAIKLQVRGEAFLHPKVFDAIKYAKSKGVMDVQITTNATMLNTQFSKKIIDSGLDGLIFSLDAHHQMSSYKRKNVSDYAQLESDIKEFLYLRNQMNSRLPWVRLQTGVSDLKSSEVSSIKEEIEIKFPDADLIVINRIHNFRDNEDSYNDLHSSYDLLPCDYLMQRLAIFWDGDVTTCCMDYNNRTQLGNINESTIEDIWLSDKMNVYRKQHKAGNREKIPICKHCCACTVNITDEKYDEFAPRHPLNKSRATYAK